MDEGRERESERGGRKQRERETFIQAKTASL
jgi:hypothetical protein